MFAKFNLLALLAGFMGNVCFSILSSVLVGFCAGFVDAFVYKVPHNENSPWFLICSFVLGMLSTGAGAYITGRVARRFPVHNAVALGIIELIITLLMVPWLESVPQWFLVAGGVVTLPCAYLGGKYAEKHMAAAERA